MKTYRLEFAPGFRVIVRQVPGDSALSLSWRVSVQKYLRSRWVDFELLGQWNDRKYAIGVAARFIVKVSI